MTTTEKILFVDDEPNILQGFQRQLRNRYPLETAVGALAALEILKASGPFAVVVTDMRMPSMNGIQFLNQVRIHWPDAVRLMLTGNADQQTAIDAVNEGCVFRFLTKPCTQEKLTGALDAALAQYSLVTAERNLLSQTLTGSVNLLSDILGLLNPTAFGKTALIRRLCNDVASHLNMANAWELSMAAGLALIGCVTVPESVLASLMRHQQITSIEQKLFNEHPQVAGRLIERIPRLERVADIVRRQNEPFCVTIKKCEEGETDQTGLAINVLKTTIDFQQFLSEGLTKFDTFARLRSSPDVYCPQVVQALEIVSVIEYVVVNVSVADLVEGMILDEHLTNIRGELLLARGNEISSTVRERIMSIAARSAGVKEPVRVLSPL